MNLAEMFSLKGKTALITGGGRGIGKFIATGLAEAGADVILTSRKMKNLEATARNLEKAYGIRALAIACDVAKEDEIENMLREAQNKFPRIDILVNNAGATWGAPTLEFPLEKWDQLFNVNVRGVWILTQKVARIMKNQGGGNIIKISQTDKPSRSGSKISRKIRSGLNCRAWLNACTPSLATMNSQLKLASRS